MKLRCRWEVAARRASSSWLTRRRLRHWRSASANPLCSDSLAPGEFSFRARDNAARLEDVVKFNWEMVRKSDGTVAAVGLGILVLGDDGRIRTDYQFIEA
jgi:hypothetical protein